MDREKLLITGSLIGIIIVILSIYLLISHTPITHNSTPLSSLNSGNSDNNLPVEEYLIFDNSTPETLAISIARLNSGMIGFDKLITANASLTSDGKYWIVKMTNYEEKWVVIIDTRTLMSKRNASRYRPMTTWRSLNELKAAYIAEIRSCNGEDIGKPYKVNLEGKIIWKVPIYDITNGKKLIAHVYIDLTSGKSKVFDMTIMKEGEWMTLKEVDDSITNMYDVPKDPPFKDALRSLYPE